MMRKNLLVTAMATFLGLTSLSCAEELAGTLKTINERGTIILGHRESSIPYSYYDNNQNVIGYSHEISLKVVQAVEAKLGKKVNIQLVPITSQNRIPLMRNGSIDFECGSTTNNTERAKEVGFTNSFFTYSIHLLTDKASGIKDFPDLASKTLVTTAGTTSERIIREMNTKDNMKMSIVAVKDHGDAFNMLADGRAAAFMMDDPLLYGERARAQDPSRWIVTGTSPADEVYACMLRRDDPQFKALADKVIADMAHSGDMEKLYEKWFLQDIPPRGINLNFPLSEEMKALFKNPNDDPLQ